MNLAYLAWNTGNLEQVDKRLNKHMSPRQAAPTRTFEFMLLQSLYHNSFPTKTVRYVAPKVYSRMCGLSNVPARQFIALLTNAGP